MKKLIVALAFLCSSVAPASAFNVIIMFEGEVTIKVFDKSGRVLHQSSTFRPFKRNGRLVRAVGYPNLTGADISRVCRYRPATLFMKVEFCITPRPTSGHVYFTS